MLNYVMSLFLIGYMSFEIYFMQGFIGLCVHVRLIAIFLLYLKTQVT